MYGLQGQGCIQKYVEALHVQVHKNNSSGQMPANMDFERLVGSKWS